MSKEHRPKVRVLETFSRGSKKLEIFLAARVLKLKQNKTKFSTIFQGFKFVAFFFKK